MLSKSGIQIKFKTKSNALKNAINQSINNTQFNLTCPNCKATFPISGFQFGSTINCPSCKIEITLNNSGLNDDINRLQKSFEKCFK